MLGNQSDSKYGVIAYLSYCRELLVIAMMYGERSSEQVNVRVVLHIRQTFPNHRLLDRDVFVCLVTGMGVTLLSRFCLGHF